MAKHGKFKTLPWLTARQGDATSSFIMLDASLMKSSVFGGLSYGGRIVYLCMAQEAQRSGQFVFPEGKAREYGISVSTLRRATRELIDSGLITIVQNGQKDRAPNRYAFDYGWKGEIPDAQRRKAQRKERAKTDQEIQADKAMANAAAEVFAREWANKKSE